MNKNANQADSVSQPVKDGEELTVTIEAVGEKGDGICKKKGFILFVPNTTEGEVCKIRVTKVLSKVGFAEVLERKGEQEKPSHENQQTPTQQRSTAPVRPSKPKKEDTEDFGKDLELEENEGSFADEFSEAFPEDESTQTAPTSEKKEATSDQSSDNSSSEDQEKEKASEDDIPTPEEDSKKKIMAEEPDDEVPEP